MTPSYSRQKAKKLSWAWSSPNWRISASHAGVRGAAVRGTGGSLDARARALRVKVRDVLGVHGVVIDVEDPDSESRRWRRALGLPVLRRSRRETVLGGPAFFVVLRRALGQAAVAEVHVAVKELSGAPRDTDALGGRSIARAMSGVRLVVRQLVAAPEAKWRAKAKRRKTAG